MGYCMDQLDSVFRIRKRKQAKALKAIRRLNARENKYAWGDIIPPANTLVDALNYWRWETETDPANGDIVSIMFTGEKAGDDLALFQAIAPYVEAGSFIGMIGEDTCMWRWYFNGKAVVEQAGSVIYAA